MFEQNLSLFLLLSCQLVIHAAALFTAILSSGDHYLSFQPLAPFIQQQNNTSLLLAYHLIVPLKHLCHFVHVMFTTTLLILDPGDGEIEDLC